MTDNTEKCTHCHRCSKGCDPCAHCGVCQRCGQHRMPVANPPQFVPIPVQIPRTQPEPWMPPPFEIWCGPIGVGNDSSAAAGMVQDQEAFVRSLAHSPTFGLS